MAILETAHDPALWASWGRRRTPGTAMTALSCGRCARAQHRANLAIMQSVRSRHLDVGTPQKCVGSYAKRDRAGRARRNKKFFPEGQIVRPETLRRYVAGTEAISTTFRLLQADLREQLKL